MWYHNKNRNTFSKRKSALYKNRGYFAGVVRFLWVFGFENTQPPGGVPSLLINF